MNARTALTDGEHLPSRIVLEQPPIRIVADEISQANRFVSAKKKISMSTDIH